jgi:hypothetical protein
MRRRVYRHSRWASTHLMCAAIVSLAGLSLVIIIRMKVGVVSSLEGSTRVLFSSQNATAACGYHLCDRRYLILEDP